MLHGNLLLIRWDLIKKLGNGIVQRQFSGFDKLQDGGMSKINWHGANGENRFWLIGDFVLAIGKAITLIDDDLPITDHQDRSLKAVPMFLLQALFQILPSQVG